MPKKRSRINNLKAHPSTSASHAIVGSEKPPKSVNERLANLRHVAAGPVSSRSLLVTLPSVPPSIREILQIPETPTLAPRQPVRQRFDNNGRRLPAGPAPPRSWVLNACDSENVTAKFLARSRRIRCSGHDKTVLPGFPLPQQGSLVDLTIKHLAADWDFHRVYNQYHLFYVPSHLKPALVRHVALRGRLTLADLRTVLLPPEGSFSNVNDINCLDLSLSIGSSLSFKDMMDLLFSYFQPAVIEGPQESWEAADSSPDPPRLLLPKLTHLALCLDPLSPQEVSWKQLLALSSKLPTLTHLSLAFWPEPCLNPRAKCSTVLSPQGHHIPYSGTTIYSHSIDHDWSESLLVLRMLSSHLYKLEFLDLTGCTSWFEALCLRDSHDFVDWSGCWSKVTLLRLFTGWKPSDEAMESDRARYSAGIDTAERVEKHVRTMRAGKGRIITVERDDKDPQARHQPTWVR